MILAVTGGSGFIGSRLVERLARQGHEIRTLSRTGGASDHGTTYIGCLGRDHSDHFIPFVDGADAVVHCAGEIADPGRMEATHVTGTRDLLAAATGRVRHWVQLSSVGVYGPADKGVLTEGSPCRPQGPYEETKAVSDSLVLKACRAGTMTTSILRPSIVFGEDMPGQSLRQMARMVEKGHFFFVGKHGASANYIHVDHVVEALDFCIRAAEARNGVFNLSDWLPLEEFIAALSSGLGCKAPRLHVAEPLVRLAASIGGIFPHFPLTRSRIDALVSRARYPADRLRQAGFELSRSLAEDVATVGAAWRT